MLSSVKSLVKHMFSEPNNHTWCPTRIAVGGCNVTYHGMFFYAVITGALHLDSGSLTKYVTDQMQLIGFGTAAIAGKSALKADATTPPTS